MTLPKAGLLLAVLSGGLGPALAFAAPRRQPQMPGVPEKRRERPAAKPRARNMALAVSGDQLQSGIDEDPGFPDVDGVFVAVDALGPYHSRKLMRRAMEKHNLAVVELLSPYMQRIMEERVGRSLPPELQMPQPERTGDDAKQWDSAPVKEWATMYPPIKAVLCDSDAGLGASEAMAAALPDTPNNGFNEARRDKFLMHELLKEKGIRAAEQKLCTTREECVEFCETLFSSDRRAIVKPRRGVGSEMVRIAANAEEAGAAFDELKGSTQYGFLDRRNEEILVQEFIEGPEYAFDTVSSEGVHKMLAMWKYDKVQANGADFVYAATILQSAAEFSQAEAAFTYIKSVLDALDIRYGPTHTELRMTINGPVLIEVNARWHDVDFNGIADACIGYNAHDLALDAYLDPDAIRALPDIPQSLKCQGRIVHLICYAKGILRSVQHVSDMQLLDSAHVFKVHEEFSKGATVSPTVDIRSDAGFVTLWHESPEQVEKDYKKILEWQRDMFVVG